MGASLVDVIALTIVLVIPQPTSTWLEVLFLPGHHHDNKHDITNYGSGILFVLHTLIKHHHPRCRRHTSVPFYPAAHFEMTSYRPLTAMRIFFPAPDSDPHPYLPTTRNVKLIVEEHSHTKVVAGNAGGSIFQSFQNFVNGCM